PALYTLSLHDALPISFPTCGKDTGVVVEPEWQSALAFNGDDACVHLLDDDFQALIGVRGADAGYQQRCDGQLYEESQIHILLKNLCSSRVASRATTRGKRMV